MNRTVKKIAFNLHLWLGCISGLIVFVVCITGAIWAVGINDWLDTAPKSVHIEAEGRTLLNPSQLLEIAKDSLRGNTPSMISYSKDEPTTIRVYGDVYIAMTMNPYSGEVLDFECHKSGEAEMSFWDYMRWGHRALWLPWDTGRMIVNYGTLTFLIVLITGLILWIPKSMKGAKNRLWFNWRKTTNGKRKVYDLHLVLGFYSSFLLIVICATGMVWGIEWWSSGLYKVTTGDDLPEWRVARSDSTNMNTTQLDLSTSIDNLFQKATAERATAQVITINYPDTTDISSAIGLRVSYNKRVLYNYDSHAYDRYTLEEISQDGYQHGRYEDKSAGEKLRRQNYDLHIGAIWGSVGRVLMFFAALFGASLPLTGYYILFKVKKKKKRSFRK